MTKKPSHLSHWTHWNYRILDMGPKGECFVLCEVFYNKKKIINYSVLNRSPLGSAIAHDWHTKAAKTEALRQLKFELKLMRLAFKLPVLKMSTLAKIPVTPF